MSDTTKAAPAKGLTTKNIKRRVEKIQSSGAAGETGKNPGKLRGKLAISILRQIADGTITNPVAASKAFVKGLPVAGAASTETTEA